MTVFPASTGLVLYSDLSPEECARRLREAIDPERHAIFSLSGYGGSKPILGRVAGLEVRLLKRTHGRNSFRPVFSGELHAQARGTRLEGGFDLGMASKIAIYFLLGLSVLIITPAIYSSTRDAVGRWAAALVASGCVALYFLLPRLVRAIGLEQEREITDFLWTILEAGDDPSAFKCGQNGATTPRRG